MKKTNIILFIILSIFFISCKERCDENTRISTFKFVHRMDMIRESSLHIDTTYDDLLYMGNIGESCYNKIEWESIVIKHLANQKNDSKIRILTLVTDSTNLVEYALQDAFVDIFIRRDSNRIYYEFRKIENGRLGVIQKTWPW
jgi:hypothetical protein